MKNINLFKRKRSFEEVNLTDHTSTLESIITMVTIILSIIIGFLFGKEVYERKNQNVFQSSQTLPYSI